MPLAIVTHGVQSQHVQFGALRQPVDKLLRQALTEGSGSIIATWMAAGRHRQHRSVGHTRYFARLRETFRRWGCRRGLELHGITALGNDEAQGIGVVVLLVIAVEQSTQPARLHPDQGAGLRIEGGGLTESFDGEGIGLEPVGSPRQGFFHQIPQEPRQIRRGLEGCILQHPLDLVPDVHRPGRLGRGEGHDTL